MLKRPRNRGQDVKSHPVAHALLAGLLQGLGEKHDDPRLKEAGKALERNPSRRRPSSADPLPGCASEHPG
jgi:hypothetical protein